MTFKVMHSTLLGTSDFGVLRQLKMEADGAEKLDLDWHTKAFGFFDLNEKCSCFFSIAKKTNPLLQKLVYYEELLKLTFNYDLILLRYLPYSFATLKFLRQCSKPVLTVHHVIEPREMESSVRFGKLKSFLDKVIGRKVLKLVSGIVAVTPEIGNYELARINPVLKPLFVYPNGVLEFDLAKDEREAQLQLLFIAANLDAPWHGLDILVKSVKSSGRRFIVHIVGDYNRIAGYENLDERLKFYGRLDQEKVSSLVAKCDLGLSCFALHRQGLKQACALKVREYLSLGLPAYGSYEEILPANFPFYKNGSFNIDEILEFAGKMKNVSRAEVSKTAQPFIDKAVLLKSLYDDLKSHFYKG